MKLNTIFLGNCFETLKTFDTNSVDSIVTDPPYELGFMGKSWDSTGIANDKNMWAECLRVLKPGGHLLAFSGTRTYHRMASAIEDAGFEVRDMIEWVYGSGFPKSLNIGKAVDKLQGNKREDLGKSDNWRPAKTKGGAGFDKLGSGEVDIRQTKGTSEWEGWGTALKPAHEPICMARKPLGEKTVAENVLKYGTGGINIDESRVETTDKLQKLDGTFTFSGGQGADMKGKHIEFVDSGLGRFPANLLHDNSEEVRECFPESTSGAKKANQENYNHEGKEFVATLGASINEYQASSGNASRFFKSIIYQAKASKSERNKGCEDMEDKERVDYGGFHSEKGLIENNRNPENRLPNKNNHPTVKPIALMEYLIKMVTPKGGVVLDPFAGSGSTLVAAKQNGFQYLGCELDPEYIKIAESRLKIIQTHLV